MAFQYVKPAPPSHLVISAGGKSGAYEQFARRYAAILARNGITLDILPSSGSLENLQRLEKGEADVAFVQGGVTMPKEEEEEGVFADAPVQSLGSAFYEPVWVFYRGSERLTRLTQLKGKRLAIGEEGSGVRQLAQQLLIANDLEKDSELLPLAGLKAAEELQQGRIDAAFVIAAQEAPVVQVLLRSPGVRVMSFTQAEAYQRRFPFLNRLIMPEGVADLVRNFPPQRYRVARPHRQPGGARRSPPGPPGLAPPGRRRGSWQVRLLPESRGISRLQGPFPALVAGSRPLLQVRPAFPGTLPALLAGHPDGPPGGPPGPLLRPAHPPSSRWRRRCTPGGSSPRSSAATAS